MIKVILVELELEHPMYDLKYSDCHEILGAIGRTQEPSIWRIWKNTRLNNFCGIEQNNVLSCSSLRTRETLTISYIFHEQLI